MYAIVFITHRRLIMQLVFGKSMLFDGEVYCTYQEWDKQHTFAEHDHDFFEFFIIHSGVCTHRINGLNETLQPGDMYFIRPRDTHLLTCAEGTLRYGIYNCNIKTDTFMQCFHALTGPGMGVDDIMGRFRLTSVQWERMRTVFDQRLMLQQETDSPGEKVSGRLLLMEALGLALQNYYRMPVCEPAWLQSLLAAMRLKKNYQVGVSRLFELSGRSREHVSRCMRQYYGISPSEYVLELKLTNAISQLLYSNLSVEQIAYENGFKNLAYFYSVFQKRFHVTPAKYRKNYKISQ